MASSPSSPRLSQQELAALDLLILAALQQGKDLDEPMSFIDSIVHAANDVAHFVADHAQEVVEVAGQVAEVTAEVAEAAGGAALHENTVAAIRRVVSAAARTPDVTLEQLIEIRRRAQSRGAHHSGKTRRR